MQISRTSPTVEDFVQQKAKVDELLKELSKDQKWYIIDLRWWNKWVTFIDSVINDGCLDLACDDYPGEVDNSILLNSGKLKPDLLREGDFTLIPESVWNIFVNFYGCAHNDTSVFRRSVVQLPSGRLTVEIYPPTFQFIDIDTQKKLFDGSFSECQTIGELKTIVRDNLKVGKEEDLRLFIRDGVVSEELTDDGVTIGEASLERQKFLYVKLSVANGLKFGSRRLDDLPSSGTLFGHPPSYASGVRHTPGVCGLSNLGNTCFMNSAIQCMSNVPELTDYFLKGSWKKDVNKFNPLGSRGKIANAYAELIEHIWSGLYSYDVPRALKREIAGIATQFYGYAQHDSHELLVFLMDGIHEDLNRVKQKPYIEVEDAHGRPDEVVAAEAWQNHLARNNSIIVDLFHGQLKSTVICPTCNYRSITFDPFASWNLPLPDVYKYTKLVYIWPWVRKGCNDQSDEMAFGPIRCEIPVQSTFYVRDFVTLLERERPPHQGCQYYLAEVYNHSVSRPWHLEHQVRDRNGPPLFAYELPPGTFLSVRLRDPRLFNTSGWVGVPFYISIPKGSEHSVSESILLQAIAERIHALGFRQPASSADEGGQQQSANNPDTAGAAVADDDCGGGDQVNTSNTVPSRTAVGGAAAVDGRVVIKESGSAVGQQSSLQKASMNGDECPLVKLLRGNVFCTDEQNQNEVQLSGEKTIDLNDFYGSLRLFIQCGGTVLQTKFDGLMRSITSSSASAACNGTKNVIDLSECIRGFVSVEKLSARDPWYCSKCKEHKQATKQFDIWFLPKIIVVQLKRFRSTYRSRDKIDTMVDFPVRGLDLTHCLARSTRKERFIYDLIAVSNHMGGLGGGHYTAYALNEPTGRWYLFDDASVHEVDEARVVTRSAYVLIYRRRETNQSNRGDSLLSSGIDDMDGLSNSDSSAGYEDEVA